MIAKRYCNCSASQHVPLLPKEQCEARTAPAWRALLLGEQWRVERPRHVQAWTKHLLGWIVLCLATAGCSKFDLRNRIPWTMGADGKIERPMKLVAMWSDTVLTVSNAKPVRGFGGRLMFYKDEGGKPVKVEGTLVVYAFDETNRDPTNNVPDRKYVFTADQLKKHYSKTELGHSYSVWLPWDEVGGEQQEIGLIVRFTPVQGGVVVGEQSRQILPGMLAAKPAAVQPPIQPVSHTEPVAAPQPQPGVIPSSPSRRRTESQTINLPRSFGRTPNAIGASPTAATSQSGSGAALNTSAIAVQAALAQQAAIYEAQRAATSNAEPATPTAQAAAAHPRFVPSTRFGQSQHRAPGGLIARPARDHGRTPQAPTERRYALPDSPAPADSATSPAGVQTVL